jgi:hypothetical protein
MKKMLRMAVLLVPAVLAAPSVWAQAARVPSPTAQKFVISAKAGGVSYAEGNVTVQQANGRSGILLVGDRLNAGDVVTTGENGRAEILLNPGSYARLGSGTSFEFVSTSLDDLELRVSKGNAIFEVFATTDFEVKVQTPTAKFALVQSGIYRVDAAGTLSVWKGRAEAGDHTLVRSGREAVVSDSTVAVANFDRDDKDELDLWSKSRAKEIAKATNSLTRRAMRPMLISSLAGGRWNIYDSYGLWIYDPFRRIHCFMPFGYGWHSPYGYGLGSGILYYNVGNTTNPVGTGGGSGAGNGSGGGNANVRAVSDRKEGAPPFIRMQAESGFGRQIMNSRSQAGEIFAPVRGVDSGSGSSSSSGDTSGGQRPVSSQKRDQ